MTTLQELFKRRQAEVEELALALPRYQVIEQHITQLRADVAHHEQRRDTLASFGNNKIEVPSGQATIPALGSYAFELEPRYSKLTGKELAQIEQRRVDDLNKEVKHLESEARALLRAAEKKSLSASFGRCAAHAADRAGYLRAEWMKAGEPILTSNPNGAQGIHPLLRVVQTAEAHAEKMRRALIKAGKAGRPPVVAMRVIKPPKLTRDK